MLDVQARVLRLLDKRGLLDIDADADKLTQDSPALAACYEGAVTQRVGLGPMKGRPVIKLGMPLYKYLAGARERVGRGGTLFANVYGFDLHGRVAFGAAQRERVEELLRYCARPPLANDRLEKRADGHYVLRLKTRWRDGTTHLQFEPIELMERLAAQIPKPRVNLVLYAGVLAPHSRWRAQAVCYARPKPAPERPASETQTRVERETWSELMRLTFRPGHAGVLTLRRTPQARGDHSRSTGGAWDLEHMGVPARATPELPPHDPPPFWPSGADACD